MLGRMDFDRARRNGWPSVIGLYSPAPRSGKTLASSFLMLNDYQVVSFAGTLKAMIKAMLEDCGYNIDEIASYMENKNLLIDELSTTPRHLMQTLGTEWGRKCIADDLWIQIWRLKTCRYPMVVADDVRFPNEAQVIKEMGGEIWRIERPGNVNQEDHASEGALDNWDGFDRIIINDGSVLDLGSKVKEALESSAKGQKG